MMCICKWQILGKRANMAGFYLLLVNHLVLKCIDDLTDEYISLYTFVITY